MAVVGVQNCLQALSFLLSCAKKPITTYSFVTLHEKLTSFQIDRRFIIVTNSIHYLVVLHIVFQSVYYMLWCTDSLNWATGLLGFESDSFRVRLHESGANRVGRTRHDKSDERILGGIWPNCEKKEITSGIRAKEPLKTQSEVWTLNYPTKCFLSVKDTLEFYIIDV